MNFKITRFQDLSPGSKRKPGTGDFVARIAKPIARGIDRVFGTRLQECADCEQRRRWLNEHFRIG